jgi:hypothetical protein
MRRRRQRFVPLLVEYDQNNLTIADRARRELERFEHLHQDIRRAYIECQFGLVVPRVPRGLDVQAMVDRILAVRSVADQNEFNRTFG